MATINVQLYWHDPPPEPTRNLLKWLAKISAGWRMNRRIGSMDYYSRAEFFGVYLWEYFNVLLPALEGSGEEVVD